MRTLLFLLSVLLFSVSLTAQSGWTQPQGAGFFKLNQSAVRAGDLFNLDGEIIDITTTSVYISSLYAEYGFSDRITGIAYIPFFVRSTLNRRESRTTGFVEPGDQVNGFGDPLIGLRIGILNKGPIVLSADAMVGIPLGENVGGDTELLQTGDGEFNQLVRLSASRSFPSADLYATLTVGFNNRTTADFDFSSGALEGAVFSDEVHWGGEVGWLPSERWLLALKWYQIFALENADSPPGMNASSLFGNNVEYFSITPEINYFIQDHFGASLSVGGALSGQNILASPNFGLGVFYIM